jgi:hypothetical protein
MNPEGSKIRSRGLSPLQADDTPGMARKTPSIPKAMPEPMQSLKKTTTSLAPPPGCIAPARVTGGIALAKLGLNPRLRIFEPSGFIHPCNALSISAPDGCVR